MLGQVRQLRSIGNVRWDRQCVATRRAHCLRLRLEQVSAPGRQDDRRATRCQLPRRSRADPGAGAGDDRHLAAEIH